jgi:hypothetical protein
LAGAAANAPVLVVNPTPTGPTFAPTDVVVCATAALAASTQAAPIANILVNLLSFMFVLCFG